MNDHKGVRKVGYVDFLKIDPASDLLRKIGQNLSFTGPRLMR